MQLCQKRGDWRVPERELYVLRAVKTTWVLNCVSADYDKHMIMMRIPVMKKYLRFSVIVPGWDCTGGSWPERRAVYKVKF